MRCSGSLAPAHHGAICRISTDLLMRINRGMNPFTLNDCTRLRCRVVALDPSGKLYFANEKTSFCCAMIRAFSSIAELVFFVMSRIIFGTCNDDRTGMRKCQVGFRLFAAVKMSQTTMNIAAITGPSTMPFMPKTSSPPSVEISTT